MTIQELLPKKIESIKRNFAENYGNRDLEMLEKEVKKSIYVASTFNLIRDFSAPSADTVFEILQKLEIVTDLAPVIKQTYDELEKRIDYGFVTCTLILEEWMNEFIPEIKRKGLNTAKHSDVLVAGMVDLAIDQIDEKFEELDKQYKNRL